MTGAFVSSTVTSVTQMEALSLPSVAVKMIGLVPSG
jgi:hypothetical protein